MYDRPAPMNVFTVEVQGYLTADEFASKLQSVSRRIQPGSKVAVVFNVARMTGYEPEVRDTYVRWHKGAKPHIGRVAVVTEKPMWRLVVATLGMATGGTTKAFEKVDDALRWAGD